MVKTQMNLSPINRIRWGILGAGNIAHRFARALSIVDGCSLYAISGRKREKLLAFQKRFPCEKIYTDYQELIDDPLVDAVYISLPHDLHKEWALKALQAKKAVLCEKPAAIDASEVSEMITEAKKQNCLFMEAMKSRFTPAYRKLYQLVNEGAIGAITSIDTCICFEIPKDQYGKTYHTIPGRGAGALLDSGIYCASLLLNFEKGMPVVKDSYVILQNGIDIYDDISLQFTDSTGRLTVGFDRTKTRKAQITGTTGSIDIDDFHRPSEFRLARGDTSQRYQIPYDHDDMYSEIQHFCSLLSAGKTESEIMSWHDSLQCAQLLDLIRDSYDRRKLL